MVEKKIRSFEQDVFEAFQDKRDPIAVLMEQVVEEGELIKVGKMKPKSADEIIREAEYNLAVGAAAMELKMPRITSGWD